jgi:hypothetical protein
MCCPACCFGVMRGGGELVGREFGEGAGAAVGRVDELDEVGVGGLEDVDDGAALAALETVLRYVPAQPNALMAPVSPGRLPRITCRGRTPW